MVWKQNFIVVDTEGKDTLREIAVLDDEGQLLYEAFAQEHPENRSIQLNKRSSQQIIHDFFNLSQSKLVVFHHASHDIQLLRSICQQVNFPWRNISIACSWELAKRTFPDLSSYSLEYLSKQLHLRVDQKSFNPERAHTARYDAEFTYQLYLKIMEHQNKKILQTKPNPFSSSKVDNPFQDHPDLKEISKNEFELLRSVIADIKHDRNHQSSGVVLIGEPGSGKTHLMMRLAHELLHVNRLLFIRQPNNPDAVLHHIYSRILESFVERVPGNGYTQLENLLAHSFVKLISTTRHINLNQRDQYILSAVSQNSLNLYDALGADGTQRKRDFWQHIERRTIEWWTDQYGLAGYSPQIIKGIVKFCSYTNPRKKEAVARWLAASELDPEELADIGLPNWNDDISKEEFSLEAISVFSRLSLLDEPLIIIFDQLEGLGLKHNETLLLNFGEAVKELFTHVPNSLIILNLFPDRWQHFQEFFDGSIVDRISQHTIHLQQPSRSQLQGILELKAASIGVPLSHLFSPAELQDILDQRSIRAVINRAADHYRHKIYNIPLPKPAQVANQFQRTQPALTEVLTERLETLENEVSKLNQIITTIARVFNLIYPQERVEPFSPMASNAPLSVANEHLLGGGNLEKKHLGEEHQTLREYLKEQKDILENGYSQLQIITDADDVGKLLTIAEAFKTIEAIEIGYLRLGKKKLPEHIVIRHSEQAEKRVCVGFLELDGSVFTTRLKNWNELVIDNRDTQFRLYRDIRQGRINGKVGRQEIEKLNNSPNGQFCWMEKEDRINFELVYKLLVDIQNKDLSFDLATALYIITIEFKNDWLVQILQ